jgi:hypothetical protein
MDTPVYSADNPDIKYDKNHLLFSLYTNDELKDPFTRTSQNIKTGIETDHVLKKEIKEFVKRVLKECLDKKMKRFTETVKKYVNAEISIDNIDKSFRMAAADDCVTDMKIIAERISSVNAKDKNEKKEYTALHWAVKRSALNAITYLLGLPNIDPDEKDAKNQSAADLAIASKNPQILNLFIQKSRPATTPAGPSPSKH